MDPAMIIFIALLALLVGGGLAYLWVYLRNNVLNKEGRGAEKKTARILKGFAGIRRFKVLSDVTLKADGKTAHVENMLIGFFGILIVHTLGARGEYYGTLDGENWILSREEGQQRRNFPNPVLEQQRALALMRSILSKRKLYNIPMEYVVYMADKGKKTGLFITHSGEILLPGKLKGFLHKTKFEKDTGLDVNKVAEALTSAN